MCTLYAFKTRNVPENFNEAKFIGFTMYTTIVIWIAFVVIYLSSEHKVTTLSLCISFSALFALFLLFFPRCYIIIFKPEKNNRSYFTTTKNVRCHIGYKIGSAGAAAAAASAASNQATQQQFPATASSTNQISGTSLMFGQNQQYNPTWASQANSHAYFDTNYTGNGQQQSAATFGAYKAASASNSLDYDNNVEHFEPTGSKFAQQQQAGELLSARGSR